MGGEVANDHKSIWQRAADAVAKAGSFVAAVTSGFVDEEHYQRRLATCMACPDREEIEGQSYCRACTCGTWALARLDRKLYFRELTCPRGRANFANEGRPCLTCGGDRSLLPLAAGDLAIITAHLPEEEPDMKPWTVTAVRGDVVDIERPRPWWQRLWRAKESATVARKALHKVTG
jgi:hypothetical protein